MEKSESIFTQQKTSRNDLLCILVPYLHFSPLHLRFPTPQKIFGSSEFGCVYVSYFLSFFIELWLWLFLDDGLISQKQASKHLDVTYFAFQADA